MHHFLFTEIRVFMLCFGYAGSPLLRVDFSCREWRPCLLWCVGFLPQWLLLLWSAGAVVVVRGLRYVKVLHSICQEI